MERKGQNWIERGYEMYSKCLIRNCIIVLLLVGLDVFGANADAASQRESDGLAYILPFIVHGGFNELAAAYRDYQVELFKEPIIGWRWEPGKLGITNESSDCLLKICKVKGRGNLDAVLRWVVQNGELAIPVSDKSLDAILDPDGWPWAGSWSVPLVVFALNPGQLLVVAMVPAGIPQSEITGVQLVRCEEFVQAELVLCPDHLFDPGALSEHDRTARIIFAMPGLDEEGDSIAGSNCSWQLFREPEGIRQLLQLIKASMMTTEVLPLEENWYPLQEEPLEVYRLPHSQMYLTYATSYAKNGTEHTPLTSSTFIDKLAAWSVLQVGLFKLPNGKSFVLCFQGTGN